MDENNKVVPEQETKAESETSSAVETAEESAQSTEPKIPKPLLAVVLGLLVVIVAAVLFVEQPDKHVAIKQFTNVYSFVPEKISKSAVIPIKLPDGVDEITAQASITLSPEIEGEWQEEDVEGTVIFKPSQPLRTGVYYAVNMDTGSVQMSGDFYVDEDPQIQAIFPNAGSETPEDSEITIVFNRPMVPLTTLTEQESVPLPITITPETAGKFKWISTRNLQFIPETTLIPSSEYTVDIGEGLYSIDGLAIAPVTHSFITRPLRYEFVSSGQIMYRSPLRIAFNQPVDLERSARNITVTDGEGKAVAVDIEYGEFKRYDREKREYVSEPDPSQLYVYQRKDKHGRQKLWDFETTYNIAITSASPIAGNKDLTSGRNSSVSVPTVIRSVSAQSERSDNVRPDLFDPTGTLTVTFYEDVDKDRSTISGKGITNVSYGEKCNTDDNGSTIYVGSSCEKVPDQSQLVFSFDASQFSTNEAFAIEFKKIITPDKFQVNAKPLNVDVRTYPDFTIYKTIPADSGQNAAVDEMIVCSNVPLRDPGEAGLSSYLQTEQYIVYGRWWDSYYVQNNTSYCAYGQFITRLKYGLLPATNYVLQLNLTSEFEQTKSESRSFTTEPAREEYTRFHNMQKQYNVTPPERTKLTYAVENMEYMDMHICRMEPETFLQFSTTQYAAPSSEGCTQVITERISLPPRYWVANYFQIDLSNYFADTRGHYVVTFSNPLYVSMQWDSSLRQSVKKQLYDRTYVSVTNLAVGSKLVEHNESNQWSASDNPDHTKLLNETIQSANNLYWVNNAKTLAPVNGATVQQFYRKQTGGVSVVTQSSPSFTNYQGLATVDVDPSVMGAVVRSGFDTAVIDPWADTLNDAQTARDASRTYVYTDRPIYRPGHEVHIKGIDRIGFDGSYEVWDGDEVELKVYDSRRTVVYEGSAEMSTYGTFDTSFELPSDAALGTYQISVFGQNYSFAVEEYVPAAFKLDVIGGDEEFINGGKLKLDVQADYYFGVPVSEGTLSYSVTAQDYYFDRYTDEYFNFGSSWYYCYYCGYGDDFLFRGEEQIGENGRAIIERELNFEDYFKDADNEMSKLVTVSLTAKDANGRSVSTQKSFVVHKGEFYLGAKTSRYYTSVNTPIELKVKSVDIEGKPIALRSIEKSVYKVSWESFKRQEVDGGFYYRSEKKLDEVSKEDISTNQNGNWTGNLSLTEEGAYEIHIKKEDNLGNVIETVQNLYIYGSRSVPVPPNNNYELDLEVEQTSLEVGDTATLLIKSPYDTAKALISIERGTVYDYWVVDVTGGLYLHEFPIKSEYAPNIFASVLLIAGEPEVKFGQMRYEIGIKEHQLDVEVTANKTHYLPGEAVTLEVSTKDHTGNPTPAEVSIAVADLSVLALKGNPKKNPSVFFYDGFPLSVSTVSNIKNILYEVDIPLGTKGGGGGDPADLATKKRGLFKDTAFWEAQVVTDSNGRATVNFTLPDNLTTWQIESLGVTTDTKLGVDYAEFTTKKDLMAVPLKPRFVVPGDTFSLGAKVFNQTDEGSTINIKLESDTLAFAGSAQSSVFINKDESKTVYFEVTAPSEMRAGEHVFTFSATTDEFADVVEQVIPITPNTTYETVATANFTKDDVVSEYIYIPEEVVSGEGGLTINANATLAVFMNDALEYMARYPYGCSEQLASSLSTIATIKSALDVPNVEGELTTIERDGVSYSIDQVVEDGLAQIYKAQNSDGGFSYYPGLQTSVPLTVHVALALHKLEVAGFTIRPEVISKAVAYIERNAVPAYLDRYEYQKEQVIYAAYVIEEITGKRSRLASVIEGFINDAAFLNEGMSSQSLAYLALITADGYSQSQKKLVYDTLKNRIDIDGRGAYLSSVGTRNRFYYETPVKNTALLLKVFAAHDDEHPAMGNVLRWLLASRDKEGVWGGTHNTFVVIDSMVEYLKWQKESESHFALKGLLNGIEIFEHEFNPQNVFDLFTKYVPIDDLERETLLPLTFERTNLNNQENNLYYDMALKYYLPVEQLPPRDEGITIERSLYKLDDAREENPLYAAEVGDVIKGKLIITIPDSYSHVAIEDIIPAGFEIVNFNLATEDQTLNDSYGEAENDDSGNWLTRLRGVFSTSQSAQVYRPDGYYGGSYGNRTRTLYPTHTESHDDRVFLYVEEMSPGVYEYEYFLRALVPGEFQHLPARAEELFFPEVFGRTSGDIVTVTE